MSKVIEISNFFFEEEVLGSAVPAVVDFYSESCGPCRLLAPILEEVAQELQGQAVVFKMNVVANLELAMRLGIAALPTVAVFKDGHEVGRLVGLQNKERLLEAVRGR
jgi:thioredoxin 1